MKVLDAVGSLDAFSELHRVIKLLEIYYWGGFNDVHTENYLVVITNNICVVCW